MHLHDASMRPPEFTGGNLSRYRLVAMSVAPASMRPPEFTGGNRRTACQQTPTSSRCFNEAAGIHRRKHRFGWGRCTACGVASMRPPEFTGGNLQTRWPRRETRRTCFNEAAGIHRRKLTYQWQVVSGSGCFNEAAGIHRRKLPGELCELVTPSRASMRPPEFTGGNSGARPWPWSKSWMLQ